MVNNILEFEPINFIVYKKYYWPVSSIISISTTVVSLEIPSSFVPETKLNKSNFPNWEGE